MLGACQWRHVNTVTGIGSRSPATAMASLGILMIRPDLQTDLPPLGTLPNVNSYT